MSLPVPVSMNPKPLSVFRLIVPWGILLTFLKKKLRCRPKLGTLSPQARIVSVTTVKRQGHEPSDRDNASDRDSDVPAATQARAGPFDERRGGLTVSTRIRPGR